MGGFDVEAVRRRFPALRREVAGQPAAFFDGPAGSQTPQTVIDAVSAYLGWTNANRGAPFANSRESDALLDGAHVTLADFLGTDDPACVSFGPNMTTLTFALSRALGRGWRAGDEIIVTRLDHDANVTPWVLAARDAGTTVHHVPVRLADCTLDLDRLASLLNERTRLVAVGFASNATGTVNPVAEIARQAHEFGALVFVDAVHYAPHRLLDVAALDCDFLACSAYKFFGPHVGVLYGKRDLLQRVEPYKLRPVPDELPGRWMTGTQNHEGIAGTAAAVEYLTDLGSEVLGPDGERSISRRAALAAAFEAIEEHERRLVSRLLDGLDRLPGFRVWGIADRSRLDERVPTVSMTHESHSPQALAARLADEGLFVWPGNHYALPFTEAAGLEPDGTLRIGLLHYNTAAEVDRLLESLARSIA